MLNCLEQEICNILFMHPNKLVEFKHRFLERDTPMWIAADFERMNVSMQTIGSTNENLFVNKSFATLYNTV